MCKRRSSPCSRTTSSSSSSSSSSSGGMRPSSWKKKTDHSPLLESWIPNPRLLLWLHLLWLHIVPFQVLLEVPVLALLHPLDAGVALCHHSFLNACPALSGVFSRGLGPSQEGAAPHASRRFLEGGATRASAARIPLLPLAGRQARKQLWPPRALESPWQHNEAESLHERRPHPPDSCKAAT